MSRNMETSTAESRDRTRLGVRVSDQLLPFQIALKHLLNDPVWAGIWKPHQSRVGAGLGWACVYLTRFYHSKLLKSIHVMTLYEPGYGNLNGQESGPDWVTRERNVPTPKCPMPLGIYIKTLCEPGFRNLTGPESGPDWVAWAWFRPACTFLFREGLESWWPIRSNTAWDGINWFFYSFT